MTLSLRALACAGAVLAALSTAACGGGGSSSSGTASDGSSKMLADTPITLSTPRPTGEVGQVTWDLPYGEPASLDPLKAYGLPENTVLANVCDALYRIGPDLSLQPALAASTRRPDATTFVFTIRSGAKFWDGHPVTAADVAYSLERQIDPGNASYYSLYAAYLKSATVTGAGEVTLKLRSPNELVEGMLASGMGTVIEKAYAEKAGAKYGAPDGGVMCSGPFELTSWQSGDQIVLTKNPSYWDSALEPKVGTFVFKFITDPSALTNGLRSGQLDGAYYVPIASIPQLQASSAGTVYYGKNLIGSLIIPLHASGPLYDAKVRRALSLAIDRQGIAQAIYQGHAGPVNWPYGSDSFGYERAQWQAAMDSQPLNPSAQPAEAKKLLAGNPNASHPIVIAVLTGDQTSNNVALAVQSAAKQVGLDVRIKILQPTQFVNLSFDLKARAGIDAYIGNNAYLDFADPLIWLFYFAQKSSNPALNPEGYDNPHENALLTKALETTDPAERMQYAVPAAKEFMDEEPLIPLVQFPLAMFMSNKITGAPTSHSTFLYYPWAAALGAR